jgi:hypothetical protein
MDSILPPAVLSVASLVSNVLSSAKAAKELAKQSGDSALKEQIGELIDSVLEVKQRVLELDEENRSLRQQLAKKAAVRRDPQFGYYFAEGDADPFCPKCYESSAKLVHLTQSEPWSGGIRRNCRECRDTFWEVQMNTNSARIVPRINRY